MTDYDRDLGYCEEAMTYCSVAEKAYKDTDSCIEFLEYLLTVPIGTHVVAYNTRIKELLAQLKEQKQ